MPIDPTYILCGFFADRWTELEMTLNPDQPLSENRGAGPPDGGVLEFAESLPVPLWIENPSGKCVLVNKAARDFIGITANSAFGDDWLDCLHPEDREGFLAPRKDPHISRRELRIRHRDGEYRWVLMQCNPRVSAQGEHLGLVGTWTDVTDVRNAERRLAHSAMHDALTALPNRALFLDRVSQVLARSRRDPRQMSAVLCLHLDRFTTMNEIMGQSAGDRLIRAFAVRLSECVPAGQTIARLSGDEFAILLDDIHWVSDAVWLARHIGETLVEPFTFDGVEVFAGTSTGIATVAPAHVRPADVLRDANIAMQRAKTSAGGRIEVFDATMHSSAVARLSLERDLHRAIERWEFTIDYQPIVALESGELRSLEALVRWRHPRRGLLGPAEFISIAEETGLIVQIERMILAEACAQLRRWQLEQNCPPQLSVSVNLSPQQFEQPDVVDEILQTLQQAELPANCLILEITEGAVMNDPVATAAVLRRLCDSGVRIAIDDFGTGYSSLGYLRRLPVDVIKIDQSFIGRVTVEPQDAQIVQTITALARNLHKELIAEGIETAEQLKFLREIGCELGQGYYFSRPLGREAMSEFLRQRSRTPLRSVA